MNQLKFLKGFNYDLIFETATRRRHFDLSENEIKKIVGSREKYEQDIAQMFFHQPDAPDLWTEEEGEKKL